MTTSLRAAIGFAADDAGNGVAYVRAGAGTGRVLRVPFNVARFAGLQGREIGYAALTAVARTLQERRVTRVQLYLEDGALAQNLNERRDVPPALTLAYVRLRCTLNQFARYELLALSSEGDLSQRARSEIALHVAA